MVTRKNEVLAVLLILAAMLVIFIAMGLVIFVGLFVATYSFNENLLRNPEIATKPLDNPAVVNSMDFSYSKNVPEFDDAIFSFDVSDEGVVAVALEPNLKSEIILFDKKNNLLGTICFENEGSSAYYICWKNDNLWILIARGEYIFEITPKGAVVSANVATDSSAFSSLMDAAQRRNNWKVGEYTYKVSKKNKLMPQFSFTTLEKVDSNGNSTILYDCNDRFYQKYNSSVFEFFSFIVAFFVTLTAVLINLAIRWKRRENEECTEEG